MSIGVGDFAAIFDREGTEELAREVGFVQRVRDIEPHDFLAALVFGSLGSVAPSLESIAGFLPGEVSRSAVEKKFKPETVEFFRGALSHALDQVQQMSLEKVEAKWFSAFPHIFLQDGSSWDLLKGLREMFPGSGGSASVANAKLQLLYEYRSGQIIPFDLVPGKNPDSRYGSLMVERVTAGDLSIFDLGYFKAETFHDIDRKDAYFVSRHKTTAGVWVRSKDKVRRLDLPRVLREAKEDAVELPVLIGVGQKKATECRLVAFRVPRHIAKLRRDRLQKTAKKKGRTHSDTTWQLCDWSIFITNAPAELVPAQLMRTIYRIRWTIELVFKQFKSLLRIHRCNSENESRMLSEALAKLIAAVLIHGLHARANIAFWRDRKQEISFDKMWKRFQERACKLCETLMKGRGSFRYCLRKVMDVVFQTCRKSHQPSRMTSLQRIDNSVGDAIPVSLSPQRIEPFTRTKVA